MTAAATVTGLWHYPVKSCAGRALERVRVERIGLAGDRRWVVVDGEGAAITARTAHAMAVIGAEPTEGGLLLTAPGLPPLAVPLPDGRQRARAEVWGSVVRGADAGPEAAAWVARAVPGAARLVHLDDPDARPTDPARSRPGDRVSFADGFPLLLASADSLAALAADVAAGPWAGEGPIGMARFRPNVVVAGAPAWQEDTWLRIRIGTTMFRSAGSCARCVMTTVDPATGRRSRHEPLATLARTRRVAGATWFGLNLVPDLPAATGADEGLDPVVALGDRVEVLEARDPGSGPQIPAGRGGPSPARTAPADERDLSR